MKIFQKTLSKYLVGLTLFTVTLIQSSVCVASLSVAEEALVRLEEFRVQNQEISGIDQKVNRLKFHYLRQLSGSQALTSCSPINVPSAFATPLKRSKKHKRCQEVVLINECDFRCEGANGIIINRSGRYRLCHNVMFKPNQPNVQAITIAASDVELDLDIFSLQQDLTNPQSGVYGIAVARDVHNVKITGVAGVAQIRDFTLAGIRVLGRTDQITVENVAVLQTTPVILTNDTIPASCADIGCAEIVQGICVGEGDPAGYVFLGTDKDNHVTNFVMRNVTARGCMIGAQLVMTFGITVDNSSFIENSYNGFLLGSLFPIAGDASKTTTELRTAADGVFTNCHFDRNVADLLHIVNPVESSGTPFKTLSAIQINEVQNFIFDNCTANDNTNSGRILTINHDAAHNMIWRNCTANRNISTGEGCDGIHFSGSLPFSLWECTDITVAQPLLQDINVVVENCSSCDNQGIGQNANGFLFAYVVGARVSDCHASGNVTVGSFAIGYQVVGQLPGGQSNGMTFLRCTAETNGITGNAGYGFEIRSNTVNVLFSECVANGNGQMNNPAQSAGGFVIVPSNIEPPPFTTSTQNIIFDGCVASGNGSANNLAGAGIYIQSPTNRAPVLNLLVQDCTLAYNNNGLVVTNNLAGLVVKNNEADQNFRAGFDLAAVSSPKLVTGNLAYNNPGGNFINVANVVSATSTTLPDGTVVGYKNLSIVP